MRSTGAPHASRPTGSSGRIIFVGAEVARAFLSSMPEPCTRFGAFGSLGYVPHTSGVNHWYNSAVNRKKAQAFLRDMTEVA
jgi:hypothetical protein